MRCSARRGAIAHHGNVEPRPLADVLEDLTPAVVSIAVTSRAPAETNPLFNDPYFRRFFDLPQMPQQRQKMSAGSGVIVDAANGYVLTNHHVIDGAGDIAVTLKDRRRLAAELVGSDKATDIAVLKIEAERLVDRRPCGRTRATKCRCKGLARRART